MIVKGLTLPECVWGRVRGDGDRMKERRGWRSRRRGDEGGGGGVMRLWGQEKEKLKPPVVDTCDPNLALTVAITSDPMWLASVCAREKVCVCACEKV